MSPFQPKVGLRHRWARCCASLWSYFAHSESGTRTAFWVPAIGVVDGRCLVISVAIPAARSNRRRTLAREMLKRGCTLLDWHEC